MANFRNHVQSNYTILPNAILKDSDLPLSVKGLYAYLLSKDSNWKFSADRIAQDTKESGTTIKKYLRELINAGYLSRTRSISGGLKSHFIYEIYPDKQQTENMVSTPRKKLERTKKPIVRKTDVHNPADIITLSKQDKKLSKGKQHLLIKFFKEEVVSEILKKYSKDHIKYYYEKAKAKAETSEVNNFANYLYTCITKDFDQYELKVLPEQKKLEDQKLANEESKKIRDQKEAQEVAERKAENIKYNKDLEKFKALPESKQQEYKDLAISKNKFLKKVSDAFLVSCAVKEMLIKESDF